MLAVDIRGVSKTYRSRFPFPMTKRALCGVTLEIEQGKLFGILGPNGAGKTTLLSILATILTADEGSVKILGLDARRDGHRIRQCINISSGNANFPWSLTVEENLKFHAMLYGLWGAPLRRKVDEVIALLRLEDYRGVPFERLSTGTKQRLSLAKALLNDPDLLLLDEPTVGLDPDISLHIRQGISSVHRDKRLTIILTTHYMKEAEQLCEELVFLKKGQIVARGTPRELKRMLASGDVINIQFAGALPELRALPVPGVLHYSIEDSSLAVTVDSKEKRLDDVLGYVRSQGATITDVTFTEPDLEDVFIELAR